jgi:hypothetical protein
MIGHVSRQVEIGERRSSTAKAAVEYGDLRALRQRRRRVAPLDVGWSDEGVRAAGAVRDRIAQTQRTMTSMS